MNLHTCPKCNFHVRSDVQAWPQCPNCTAIMRSEPIIATQGTRPCDARCMYAKGNQCECLCVGKNHGAGWTAGPGAFAKYTQSKTRAAIRRGHGTIDAGQQALDL